MPHSFSHIYTLSLAIVYNNSIRLKYGQISDIGIRTKKLSKVQMKTKYDDVLSPFATWKALTEDK